MNSRFDQAVEQILNEHVVEEAAPGMASAPGAQPEKKEGSSLWDKVKGVGRLVSPIASTALGFTPTGLRTGVGAVMGVPRGISNVYQGKKWDAETDPKKDSSSSTQPGQASQPAPTTTTQPQANASTKTVANIIPTVQPQKINSVISNFPQLNADKAHLQSAIPNLLRGLRGNYTAPELVQMVTASIPPGSRVRQIASNNAAMNKIGIDLQNYLALSDKDRAQLKAQIPALLKGIKSNATIEDVGQLLTNVLS